MARFLGALDTLEKKAERMNIFSRIPPAPFVQGGRPSRFFGRGYEFSHAREYVFGDDARQIDWNVTSRMARPFVKVFEEEKGMRICLVVDQSLSMFFCGAEKYMKAAETAALVLLCAKKSDLEEAALFFDGGVRRSFPFGKSNVTRILSALDVVEDVKRGSALEAALFALDAATRAGDIALVISDFKCGGWEDALFRFSHKKHVVLVHITSPFDFDAQDFGSIQISDLESDARRVFFTGSRLCKENWRKDFLKKKEDLMLLCKRCGASYLEIPVQKDAEPALSAFFCAGGAV